MEFGTFELFVEYFVGGVSIMGLDDFVESGAFVNGNWI